ncbi:hypothetical protein Tco_0656679 [Tanacetum coccineum]|uniref:Uncharacterized protein n=1 Tax=Tanacetum coccineum TaxID=301880 RepID=A0ABQ4XA40_9ASTR
MRRVGTVRVAGRHVSMIAIGRIVGFKPREWINLEMWLKVVAGRQVLKLADGVPIHPTGSLVLLSHPAVEPSPSLVLMTHPMCLMDLPFTLAHVAVDVRGAPNPFVSPLSIAFLIITSTLSCNFSSSRPTTLTLMEFHDYPHLNQ